MSFLSQSEVWFWTFELLNVFWSCRWKIIEIVFTCINECHKISFYFVHHFKNTCEHLHRQCSSVGEVVVYLPSISLPGKLKMQTVRACELIFYIIFNTKPRSEGVLNEGLCSQLVLSLWTQWRSLNTTLVLNFAGSFRNFSPIMRLLPVFPTWFWPPLVF